jgi:hypothetical protein
LAEFVPAPEVASDFAGAAARVVLRFGVVPVARFLAGVDFARARVGVGSGLASASTATTAAALGCLSAVIVRSIVAAKRGRCAIHST